MPVPIRRLTLDRLMRILKSTLLHIELLVGNGLLLVLGSLDVYLVTLLDVLLEALVSCWNLLICESRYSCEIFLDKHSVGELGRTLLWNLVVSD